MSTSMSTSTDNNNNNNNNNNINNNNNYSLSSSPPSTSLEVTTILQQQQQQQQQQQHQQTVDDTQQQQQQKFSRSSPTLSIQRRTFSMSGSNSATVAGVTQQQGVDNKVIFDKDDPFMSKTYIGSVLESVTPTQSFIEPQLPTSPDTSTQNSPTASTTPTSDTTTTTPTKITIVAETGTGTVGTGTTGTTSSITTDSLLESILSFPEIPSKGSPGSSPWSKAQQQQQQQQQSQPNPQQITTPALNIPSTSSSSSSDPPRTPSPTIPLSPSWSFASHKRVASESTTTASPPTSASASSSFISFNQRSSMNVTSLSASASSLEDARPKSMIIQDMSTLARSETVQQQQQQQPTTTTTTCSLAAELDDAESLNGVTPRLPPKPMYYDDDESSSSEEEYDEDSSDSDEMMLSNTSLSVAIDEHSATTVTFNLHDLTDTVIVHVLSFMVAEDLLTISRVGKRLNTLVNQTQSLWKDLTVHYLKVFEEPCDVNLWDEELLQQSHSHQQQQQQAAAAMASSKSLSTKDKRSVTLSSKDQRKSVIDVGKKGKGGSTLSLATGASMATAVSSQANSTVMALNFTLRKLTPLTSVPSTDEVNEFINHCHTFPATMLLRKLIQRYLVPREFCYAANVDQWRRMVEVPIQLRVAKLLRKVVDHKPLKLGYPSLLILKSFVRGYLVSTSDMARGINLSIQRRLTMSSAIKRVDMAKMSENSSILTRIFMTLDLNSICSCLLVCKRWNHAVSNGNIWEHLYLQYKKRLYNDEEDISIWDEVNPVKYYIEINAALSISTPPMLSPGALSPLAFAGLSNISGSSSNNNANNSITSSPLTLGSSGSGLVQPSKLSIEENTMDDTVSSTTTTATATPITTSVTATPLATAATPSTAVDEIDALSTSSPALASSVAPTPTPVTPGDTTPKLYLMTLNQLVEKLTSIITIIDISELNACLTTYRTFTTTPKLIYKLLQRFHVPRPIEATPISPVEWKKRIVSPIQHNVCKVLKKLIDEQSADFNQDVIDVLKIFLQHILVDKTSLTNYLKRSFIIKVLKFDIGLQPGGIGHPQSNANKRATKVGLRMMSWKPSQVFSEVLSLPAEEIARQLTMIEFEIYSKIHSDEFLNQAWAKEKTKHLAPNIRSAIDRFNLITKWVCTVILKEEKIRGRVKCISKLLKVAKVLRSHANYHSLMAILSGLNEAPIHRLKFTFAELKPKIQKLCSELQALMTVEGNHETYRTELNSIYGKQPCIPYLGVFLKDITFYQEGSAGQSADGINLKQSKNVYSVLRSIRSCQKNPYTFEQNPRLYEFLVNLMVSNEDELYSLSLLREPRNCKRSDLI
ncbi:hypothetical protein SAMD00019534_041260 [Acytostelium subglobosum LB1]|uniref:hypothetical protein n=1 Tax=Acytostelium subglobosum LB1 TaxID=1410327 RepID=UPI000644EC06|nr:hypothetical protein SAMD00019534_041260 [Acytostelium subglobosum LB1]GAM20951.1 hypothetical protein SAMD00019534_041260 [Acytostelium subglobosum LB1]|eukprot:XP_012756085.1 hypothetical protein SAMD00019534_041260 [Acytostelium subglobosum LB1]